MQDKKAFRIGPLVIKTTLVVLTFFFLYYEIFRKHDINELFEMYKASYHEHKWLYLLLFVLMLVNWAIETRKWVYLLGNGVRISFVKAFQAVWTGVAVSLFTPNRVGEFGGRLLFFKPENRVRSVSATLAGSVAQFMATILFGVVCTSWYLVNAGNTDFEAGSWIYLLALGSLIIFLFLYFKLATISRWFEKRRWHKYISQTFGVLSQYNREQLFVNLWFSCMRYLIFALQLGIAMFVLIEFYEFDLVFVASVVGTYFLLQTAIPSVALSEIGVRGAILAFLLIDSLPDKDLAPLILAGTLLWFVNIIIPAIFGAFFIFRTRISERTS